MTAELLLVRHGQTDWNVEQRLQGHGGPGLNDLGREQAQDTVCAFSEYDVAAMYASDLARAAETAEIVSNSIGLPFATDPRLRERHQGDWQGCLRADVQHEYSEVRNQFRADPVNGAPPNGETGQQVLDRVIEALDEIVARHDGGRIVIVTHGQVIVLLRCYREKHSVNMFWELLPKNGEVVVMTWPPG